MATLQPYEAGALNAWTPAQQGALNAERYTKQLTHDYLEEKREEERAERKPIQDAIDAARARGDDKEKERLKKQMAKLDEKWGPELRAWEDEKTHVGQMKMDDKKKKRKREEGYGQARVVSAGQVVDNVIMSWSPPIHAFLDVFGPPHIVIIPFIGAHILYWLRAPWYLRFLTFYPLVYMIPILSAMKSLKDRKQRLLWICYFMQLAVVEYCELLFYRDRTRSAVMWPKLKAILCLIGYTVVEPGNDPVYGAVKLLQVLLKPPPPTEAEQREAKLEKEKERKKREEEAKKAKEKRDEAKAKAKAEAEAQAQGKK